MKHDITVERFGVRLRPVNLADAGLIVRLRNSPHALAFIGDSAQTVPEQETWLERHFQQPDDYCFIIETAQDGRGVGMLGIYGIAGDTGEWGRWVIEPGVPAAAASAWLVLQVCFETLGLQTVRGLIVETNKEVLSFHERIGYERIGFHSETRVIRGLPARLVEFRTTRNDWPRVAATLERYAVMAQKLMVMSHD